MQQTPLFPLNTVLFPGTRLSLRIFEQRYLEMVKNCLKKEQDFVVVLISKGREVGLIPEICSVGTRAAIIDWNQLEGGILGITVEGRQRVHIGATSGALGELLRGKTRLLEDSGNDKPDNNASFVTLLQKLEQHPLIQAHGMNIDYQDFTSVMWGLSSLLPFNNTQKQYLLELDDPQIRYQALSKMLQELED